MHVVRHTSVESGPRSGQWQGCMVLTLSVLTQLVVRLGDSGGHGKDLRFRAWAARSSLLTLSYSSFVQDTLIGSWVGGNR